MDPTLSRRIDTLRTAQDALRSEMDMWAEAAILDEVRLEHLRELARDFQAQAHSVLVMMLYEDTPETLQQDVDGLVGGFAEVVNQAEALLAGEKKNA
jgi:hypothetical protein